MEQNIMQVVIDNVLWYTTIGVILMADKEPVQSGSKTTKPMDDQWLRSPRNTNNDANNNLSSNASNGQGGSSGHGEGTYDS